MVDYAGIEHYIDGFIYFDIHMRGDSLRQDLRGDHKKKELGYERSSVVLGGISAELYCGIHDVCGKREKRVNGLTRRNL